MNYPTMTDDELATAVRESVTSVHMTIPAEQIATRGRTIRARRRIPLLTGALAGAAGAALAVSAMLPPGHQASPPVTAQLAAWTVAKQANGDIRITFRDMRDPAGLQRTLRADGLPVNVSFSPPSGTPFARQNPACRGYPASTGGSTQLSRAVEMHPARNSAVLVIHPRALPEGAGLWIYDRSGFRPSPHAKVLLPLAIALVQATPQCTGS
jgi:hypothetical protein